MKAVRPRAMAMGLTDQRSMRRVVPNPRRAVPGGLVAGRGLDEAALRDLVGRGHRRRRGVGLGRDIMETLRFLRRPVRRGVSRGAT